MAIIYELFDLFSQSVGVVVLYVVACRLQLFICLLVRDVVCPGLPGKGKMHISFRLVRHAVCVCLPAYLPRCLCAVYEGH